MTKAFAAQSIDDEASINYISIRNKDKNKQSRPFIPTQKRGSSHPPFPNRGPPGRAVNKGNNSTEMKFCRIYVVSQGVTLVYFPVMKSVIVHA